MNNSMSKVELARSSNQCTEEARDMHLSNNSLQREERQHLFDNERSELEQEEIFPEAPKEGDEEAVVAHWFWDSWVFLSIVAALMFSIYNVFMGELADLGLKSLYYLGSGSLIPSLAYFIYSKEWSKRNTRGMLDSHDKKKRKVLLCTWGNNKFDWKAFACLCI